MVFSSKIVLAFMLRGEKKVIKIERETWVRERKIGRETGVGERKIETGWEGEREKLKERQGWARERET